ncbi:MAG: VWA domain-containing protein [Pseudomonadota bacterium]
MAAAAPTCEGRLVENIVHFAQALRKAGLKVGTAQVETAIEAVQAAGFSHRVDFYHTLRATMITRADHLEVFHQVFSMFWRDPEFLENLLQMFSPRMTDDTPPPLPDAGQRRAEDALGSPPPSNTQRPRQEITQHAALTWSVNEIFKRMDFEQMSVSELAEAERAVRALTLPVTPLLSRRSRPNRHGYRPDHRTTMRKACRRAGEINEIARKAPLKRKPDLVAICDISGSMSTYSRMIMRYIHAITHATEPEWGHVHAFTFGTSLTNVTRALRVDDPDIALAKIGSEATDWEGGTRIGSALEKFNKTWSRRVLSSGAIVLLITDGLERDDLSRLTHEAARLARSSRKFIWLNPLLRFDGFLAKAGGIKTLLRHVDSFHACHSLDSLLNLSEALGDPGLRDRFLARGNLVN